jgi:DNA repair exonuclease SbcCD ATPase subunit
MNKIVTAALLFSLLLAACDSGNRKGGFNNEYQKAQDAYTRIADELDQQLERYDSYYEQYMAFRQEYDSNPNNLIGKDSLHTTIRNQHDMLLERHADLKRLGLEFIEHHDGVLDRHDVETYPKDSILIDYKRMNEDLLKTRSYLDDRNDEIMQMIEEQQGMLQYITS